MALGSSLRSARARAILLAVALWAFGLSTTTLLVGVWGRSVTGDDVVMTSSALALLDTDAVTNQIAEWMAGEAASVPGVPGETIAPALRSVAESAPARIAVEAVVGDLVSAASAPPGSETTIDVAGALEPLRPVLIDTLAASSIDASPAQVDSFLRQIERLVLTSSERAVADRPVATARSTLTVVLLTGAAGLAAFGGVATWLGDDRVRMVRSLGNRLVVSALTFALFLRIGAWAVDPRGGRSPVREIGSIVLASNLPAVMAVALGGVAVSVATSLAIRRMRGLRPVDPRREPVRLAISGRVPPRRSA